MRKLLRMGDPVRVSTGDRDLDELSAEIAVITRSVDSMPPRPSHPPLDEQFQINRAPFIVPKAVIEGMPKPIKAEMLRAPVIGAIQKRTMANLLGHRINREAVGLK
jgi:hypothetical protein